MRKVKSGVKNLDKILGGGIPEKELILVEGEPGSGKSNLGLEYLYRGAQRGENGLYVSFQSNKSEILRTTTFDWNFEEAVESGNIRITNFDPYRYEEVANMLRSAIKENNAKRVVLDPITDLDLYINSRKDQRKNLLEIKNELEKMECTALLIAEEEESTELEEETADGIIQMNLKRDKDQLKRELYVKKLTGADFNQKVHRYVFESDGLKVK